MKLKSVYSSAFSFLKNSQSSFQSVFSSSLEDCLEKYMKMLLIAGLFASIASFIIFLLNSLYLSIFRDVPILAWRMLNYAVSVSSGYFMVYLFLGTFGLFLLVLLFKVFFRNIRLDALIKLFCYSMFPILLFGWIHPSLAYALMVWSAFLVIVGIKSYSDKK